ncbi:MAG: hypothetical protein AB1393_03180 [Candidatus Edwardsbacteria bacterium]
MSKRKKILTIKLLLTFLLGFTCLVTSAGGDYSFSVDQNISHLYLNPDGSINLYYELTFTCAQNGQTIDIVDIGMPNGDYDLNTAQAEMDGEKISDIRVSEYVKPYGVETHLGSRSIRPGTRGTLNFSIRVRNMVWEDDRDKNYASLEFSPTWYGSQFTYGSTHLEVYFHLPEGVLPEEPRYHKIPFSEAYYDSSEHRLIYKWVNYNASPSRQYLFGASFPKKYVSAVISKPKVSISTFLGALFLKIIQLIMGSCPCFFIFIMASVAIGSVVQQQRRKMKYLPPSIGIEGVGLKRGLTAVEAALLLELPLNKVLTMILFGLIKKGAVKVKRSEPLSLQILEKPPNLYDYEKGFLEAIAPEDGKVSEGKLREVMIDLIRSVNNKMKGFSRKETVVYYKQIVGQAWEQVKTAQTPELKSQSLNEQFDWLMMDKNYEDRMNEIFGSGLIYLPGWWGRYDHTYAGPTPSPLPSGEGKGLPEISMPQLPGTNFANSIVTGVENFSNSLVSKLDSFTGKVTAVTNPPPVYSGGGGGGGGCACACACAGCACACAGGGR